MKPRDIFTSYYQNNFWGDLESASGSGSNMAATSAVRAQLPTLFSTLGIKSLLDIPCGDFYWFSQMLDDTILNLYIGADIVPELIVQNQHDFTTPGRAVYFETLDATNDTLPVVDAILCRDMLGHLTNYDVVETIKNFKRSGARWLLATTFPHHDNANENIHTGQWRPINLSDWRLGLGAPKLLIDEKQKGKFNDKQLGLWELQT